MIRCFVFLSFFFMLPDATGQNRIYTKEGRSILNRTELIFSCLRSLNKTKSDKTALAICECQTDKLNGKFTNKQYRQFTKNNVIDLSGLVKTDSLLVKEIQDCYTASGQTILLQAEGSESEFMEQCRTSIESSSDKKLDADRVSRFCQCQLQMVKSRKLSDAEMKTLSNPNSLLFFEMMYRCGDPFGKSLDTVRNWTPLQTNDVKGPAADTVNVLSFSGMTYVKVKVGSLVQVWLFDTGASDLMINADMESELKKEGVLTQANYLGIGEYEMANGTVDTCRRYKVNNIQIGNFSVDNIVISVSDKGKRIIVGKALLNKFRNWNLDNREHKLTLTR